MVQLVVKGTKHADEFVYVCKCADTCGPLATTLTLIQNRRHRVRLQLYSVFDLLETAARANAELALEYKALYEEVDRNMKNPKLEVSDFMFDTYWTKIKDLTCRLFPSECVHPDGDEAAVGRLYEMHDNPDIDENFRAHIYHCRAILDGEYRSHEVLNVNSSVMWFCGKVMASDDTVGKYCGNNEKSRVTVKLGPIDGVAPSKEPRLDYAQQRELHALYSARREEFVNLEESELRDKAIARARAERKAEGMSALGSGGGGDFKLNLSGVRPIHNSAQVTVSDAA